jgi:hypothetical protein
MVKPDFRVLEPDGEIEELAEHIIISLRFPEKSSRFGQERAEHEQRIEPGPAAPGLEFKTEASVDETRGSVLVVSGRPGEDSKICVAGPSCLELEKSVQDGAALIDRPAPELFL